MSYSVDRRGFLRVSGAAAATAALGLASCSSDTSGPVTLSWWDYFTLDNFQPGMNRLIKDIEAGVPDVRIERRTFPFAELERQITLGAISGDLPDLAIVDNVSMNTLGGSRLLADLTARVDAWGQADAYYKGPWSGCQVGGKTLGIPNNSNCLALYCNTRMLEAAGVEPPTTWDELAATAQKLTSGDRYGLALSAIRTEEGVFQFLPFLWQAGGDLDSFSTYGATALAFLDELIAKGSLSEQCVGWTQQDVNTRFLNQRAAMQINGPWQIPTLKKADFDWNVVPLPRDKEAATCLGGENWVVMAGSKHVDKAWEVLEYTQRPSVLVPYLVSFGELPARKDLADRGSWASDPALRLFLSQLPLARPRQYGAHYAEASQAVAEAQQAVLTGSASPSAAARTAAKKIDKALGEQ
ncbi:MULTISPECIES: sugar ABC transporter substrate-binding protein [unclassified Streptomyces]|uniref:ABC transporter substrate-binding protein n=1 Tax=unclassified Streptomyces TaxID=2593676 RepID=UPI001BAE99A9|nr:MULTISPECIES: sugar ABC transporter substrate-binding protein [unclassified Streptomyces]MDH6447832.1 multiple sugar transport system substrate-binding protein [Streptomyces sp. SAI-119]MDH6501445.1 multiple sugar transport system substrate-binding protein [Streptomyces sp. SAI-149]QUC60120.1 sugar ABC transporter substrate-binding protein [Streptomyces sp. A2-16]